MPSLFAMPPLEYDGPAAGRGSWPAGTADTDPYDPRKPEYVRPASPQEVDDRNAELLEQQIRKLETTIAKKKEIPEASPKNEGVEVVEHYEHVLGKMRSSVGLVPGPRARTTSAPDLDAWLPAPEARAARGPPAGEAAGRGPVRGAGQRGARGARRAAGQAEHQGEPRRAPEELLRGGAREALPGGRPGEDLPGQGEAEAGGVGPAKPHADARPRPL
eukprot:CAMPEP_0179279638 /NCGR_PEP_ID=MMETSP0797-20121207/36216_1 /TAXON_ID=47934 /ORGANISM="Dinophysis acuminata, Strain DAEP01" /LENGTH=216 /DNA_ID=CAMNT_0020988271 /DNA_START=119 /DNA_END=765 /DNA_ORIENTATION=+